MANKQNIKTPKKVGPGRPPKKKSKQLNPAEEIPKTPPPQPKPQPKTKKVIDNCPKPNNKNVPDLVMMATQGLLGLSGTPSKRKRTNSLSEGEKQPAEDLDDGNFFSTHWQLDSNEKNGASGSADEEDEDSDSSEEEDDGKLQSSVQVYWLRTHRCADSFELEFLIPIDGATDSCTLASDITWSEFTSQVSDEIGVRRKDLKLAYKFSTDTQRALPRLLKTAAHLEALFGGAKMEMAALEKSNSKTKKPFKVILVDRDAGKKGGNTKAKGSKKVCYTLTTVNVWFSYVS